MRRILVRTISIFVIIGFIAGIVYLVATFYGEDIKAYSDKNLLLPSADTLFEDVSAKIFPESSQFMTRTETVAPVFVAQQNTPVKHTETKKSEVSYYSISDHNAKLYIDSVNIAGHVVAGANESTMNHGLWHYPTSSASFLYGNTVIIGHRFLKLPPHTDTFYNLDKVQIGDVVRISVSDGELFYTVYDKKIVETSDTYILDSGEDPVLTLVTCHPLWTSKQRLVIMAHLVQSTVKL